MSTALALRKPEQLRPRALRSPPTGVGLGTAVQTLEGCVSAFFSLDGYDRRAGVANYALRVVNRTRSLLVCRTWVMSRSGDALLAHPVLIEVAPLSATATQVSVWPADFASFERAIAEIVGDGVHCIVEAPAPVSRKPRFTLAMLSAVSASAGMLALVAALGLRALLPQPAVAAKPPPAPRPIAHVHGGAQIESVSVNPVVAKPGETVSVAYAAMGDGGYVALLGTDGTIWQERPFSRHGEATFVVPPVSGSHEMRVLVHVTRGRSIAQSMAGLVVANQTLSAQGTAPQIVGDDEPNAPPAASDGNGTFQVLDASVKSGSSIRVHILSPRNDMRLVLTDGQSHEVASLNIGADATDVTLRAPVVYVPTRYTIVATFTDGFGQETVVAPVTVTP